VVAVVFALFAAGCGVRADEAGSGEVPVGEAYVVAIAAACADVCPPEADVVVVHDAAEATRAIAAAYPGVRFVDDSVFEGPELSAPVIRVVRATRFADPNVLLIRVETNRLDSSWSAVDVLVRYDGARWRISDEEYATTTTQANS